MRTEPRSAAPIPPIDTIREAVRPIAEEYEARLVILFGSLARGDERPGDLDLAVRGDAPLPLVDLTNELIRALQYQQVDLTDLMAEHTGLKRTDGLIGLQSHNGRVEFRDIRVKDLAPKATE